MTSFKDEITDVMRRERRPEEIFYCYTCRTYSNYSTQAEFHKGHSGLRTKPQEFFFTIRHPTVGLKGEVIWIMNYE